LDMLMIWGRPFMNESLYDILYSKWERGLSSAYMHMGLDFALEEEASWARISSPKGSIISIDKTESYRPSYKKVVKIPKNKCHFIHCLPPLQEYYKNGNLPDETCRKYMNTPTEEPETAAATAPLASIALTLTAILATRMHLL